MTSLFPIFVDCQVLSLLLLMATIRPCHAWSLSNSPSLSADVQQRPMMMMSMTKTSIPFASLSSRRSFVHAGVASAAGIFLLYPTRHVLARGDDSADPSSTTAVLEQQQQEEVRVQLTGEAKKLFNEGLTLEGKGNMAAAQRLYTKVTRMEPRFVYGWSNLGNTQTAFGDLQSAEESYTKSIQLCQENLKQSEASAGMGVRRCNDLYILFLNRGTIRLNNGMKEQALQDLTQSNFLRGRPDAIILQNLARAEELNGQYSRADKDYTVAISMTSNEVNPFWLRSGMVKYQLGDVQGAMDLIKRVSVRFPEAPEVRAAYGVLLLAQGDAVAGQRKYLEIPDIQRVKYVNSNYLEKTIAWSPAMQSGLAKITNAVGDNARFKNGM